MNVNIIMYSIHVTCISHVYAIHATILTISIYIIHVHVYCRLLILLLVKCSNDVSHDNDSPPTLRLALLLFKIIHICYSLHKCTI